MAIKILDCTLRDGGYINNWNFGKNRISAVINKLYRSRIDVIEIGFLNDKVEYERGSSLLDSVQRAVDYIEKADVSVSCNCVAMIMHGQFSCEDLPERKDLSLSGIRYCFKKEYVKEALENCCKICEKGYDVYLQPAFLTGYSDYEILNLVYEANKLDLAAFYMVDTYGVMRRNDVIRYFYIIDHNLKPEIPIGFHSHNNLQLSFSNAQELIQMCTGRDMLIDASVLGMGRGAGNLCTELIAQYLNENVKERYDLIPILEIMDEHIMPIYVKHPWGYAAPYYVAAINDCHPNYATYLMNRQTLHIRDINSIIKNIPEEKKHVYDEEAVSSYYLNYQKHHVDDKNVLHKLSELCRNHEILILAPGKSLVTKQKKIKDYIDVHKPVIFAVNHIPEFYSYDQVFISNLKRFSDIEDDIFELKGKLICTSNITANAEISVVNYSDYLNDEDVISDNAGLILINVLKDAGVKRLALAGYDGFRYSENNYFDEKMINSAQYEKQVQMNHAVIRYFKKIRKSMEIEFITPTIYDV